MPRLSKKTMFAIEAVLDVAFHVGEHPVRSGDITERQRIPKRYLEQVLQHLVRAGILAVSRGQTEAAHALGLRPGPTLRLVVIPQAMRVIIPPLTSQYLNLTKNSTLAVAIGYPDLVQVFTGTVLNQTGQAVEVVVITMAVYLTISLVTSMAMNLYNARMALVER